MLTEKQKFNESDFFESREDIKRYQSRISSNQNDRALIFADEQYRYIKIPNTKAKYLLANYYKEKYQVDILVVSAPEKLRNIIDSLRHQNNQVRIGIVLSCSSDANIHSIPVIYEKNGANESVIVLDSRGHKGAYGFGIDNISEIVNAGRSNPIKIYANGFHNADVSAIRQADSYSCHNDAFVILKDALRSPSILNELKCVKQATYRSCTYYSFLLPEQLSKTVQVSDYIGGNGMQSDLQKIIHKRKNRADGETLQEFRSRHTVKLARNEIITHASSPSENVGDKTGHVEIKEMNVYLKSKGHSNVKRVEQQFNKHQNDLNAIYKDRSGENFCHKDSVCRLI